jgi:hypothetical protein
VRTYVSWLLADPSSSCSASSRPTDGRRCRERAARRRIEHLAHYDMVTTLPNRVLLADRLAQGDRARATFRKRLRPC